MLQFRALSLATEGMFSQKLPNVLQDVSKYDRNLTRSRLSPGISMPFSAHGFVRQKLIPLMRQLTDVAPNAELGDSLRRILNVLRREEPRRPLESAAGLTMLTVKCLRIIVVLAWPTWYKVLPHFGG